MSGSVQLWPTAISDHARSVDLLTASFGAMVWLLTLPVFVLLVVFAIRYRRSRDVNREHAPDRNLWVELSWSIVPFLLTLGFYAWATILFFDLQRPPSNPIEINVVAKQWMWKFQHADGTREIDELHVPSGRPVRLVMTSQDVIHSLFLPALRIKQDVVPGRYTKMWFEADRPGAYDLRCAEFCGADHSQMVGRFVVMPEDEFAKWLARSGGGGTDATLAAAGERLFRSLGCSGCHGPASSLHAPPLDGIFGRPVALSDGRTIVADEQYLHDSIMLPNRQVAAGYRPMMPTYGNVLGPEKVNALVAYLKSTSGGVERP